MRSNWDPNSPFDCLIKQLEDGQDYAEDGGQPYTTEQLLHITYTLVFKTGLYFEECKQWNNCPATERLGPTSKPNSTMPNAFFTTNSAPPNKQASIATMPIIHPPPKPNPTLNTARL